MHFHLSHVHRTELKPGSVVYILLMCRTQYIYIYKRHVFDNIIKDNKCIYQKVDSLHFIPYHCFTDAAFRLLITFVQGLFVWVEQLAFIHLLLTKARLAVLSENHQWKYTHWPLHYLHLESTGLDPGFAFRTASVLCATDSQCWKYFSEILSYIYMTASHGCCRFVAVHQRRISCFTRSQRCSTVLRPGDCGGHLSTMSSL